MPDANHSLLILTSAMSHASTLAAFAGVIVCVWLWGRSAVAPMFTVGFGLLVCAESYRLGASFLIFRCFGGPSAGQDAIVSVGHAILHVAGLVCLVVATALILRRQRPDKAEPRSGS